MIASITGSAVALHCCKAHSKSIGKIENLTPCKIVTPENFILKLGYVIMSRTSPTTKFSCTSLQWGILHK